MTYRFPYHKRQSGAALIMSLIVLIVLTGLGIATMNMSAFQNKITANQKITARTFAAAEMALEEGKERYEDHKQTGSYSLGWRHYLGTASNATEYFGYNPDDSDHSLDNSNLNANYVIEYRHKTEWDMQEQGHSVAAPFYLDMDGSPSPVGSSVTGSVMHYGYANAGDTVPRFFTPNGVTSAWPVEVVTTISWETGSQRIIETEFVKNPGPPVQGTVYSRQDVTINGSSGNFSGVDQCGAAPSIPPVYTLDPAVSNLSGSPTFYGSPANPVNGPNDIDIIYMIEALRPGATVITTDINNTTLGSPSDFEIFYSDTSDPYNNNGLKLQNVTGYGALLVEGDLQLGGNVDWNGVILVSGTIWFNGGGQSINVRGAAFSTQSIDINGGLDLRYDSCNIRDALDALPLVVIRWRQLN